MTLTALSPSLSTGHHTVRVALDVPLPGLFDYHCDTPVPVGVRVIVPFGRRQLIGVVVEHPHTPEVAAENIRTVVQVLDDLPPLSPAWRRMVAFAARYYQRPLGEVMLPVLPASLRRVAAYQGKRANGGPVARLDQRRARRKPKPATANATSNTTASDAANHTSAAPSFPAPVLNAEQSQALAAIRACQGYQTFLLYGVTGSGKTEVYLHAAAHVLAQGRQVLLLVPEINLTPQFEASLRARLGDVVQDEAVAILHSGLAEGERLDAWLRVARGEARILLGTRLAVFTPMPDLGLVIVDEEHETSYKQQEGLRYSARDLAIWRGHDLSIPVVLGSATPSLESWHHAQAGQYRLLTMAQRARGHDLPTVKLIDTRRLELQQGFAPQLLQAMHTHLARGEQVLIFLNRRGFAPVLRCGSCEWVSACPRCSAYTVLHRGHGQRYVLQCHHCGYQAPVPRACPACGNQDLSPLGRGTQRVEEFLAEAFPQARIARIDADSTRKKGSAAALFAQVHAGDIDILIGTQMVAKGHDFARLGLVGVLNADAMLFAQDFRAPERLFAQLMQVAGRAGRHAHGAQVLVQTDYPTEAIYQALMRHDYAGFARTGLQQRQDTGMPPYAHQALLVAEDRELARALDFLAVARAQAPIPAGVHLYDPVPLRVVRVAHIERAQLLIESPNRTALQRFLPAWSEPLFTLGRTQRVRWTLEVDPLEI